MNPLKAVPAAQARHAPSLRMRLTLTYVGLFLVLLIGIGSFFRVSLSSIVQDRARDFVTEDWLALRGFLELNNGNVSWQLHQKEEEEAALVARLRKVLLVADAQGNVLEISPVYQQFGPESKELIRDMVARRTASFEERSTPNNTPYLIKRGWLRENDTDLFVAIGIEMGEDKAVIDRFTWYYFSLIPLLLFIAAILGWFLAGRALRPVQELSQAAQTISPRNLNLRLTPRGTGDEVDLLIHTFNNMLDRLETNFTQMQQFTMDASHELRTPLTAIRGQLEVALMSDGTKAQYREAMENSLQDVERLSRVVKSLIQLAQAESGQLVLQRRNTDLSALLSDVVSHFEFPAEENRLRMVVVKPESCFARIDPIQFERLMSNLISNAVKYNRVGGEIRITLAREPSRVMFTVSDDGKGIEPEHLPFIFDRFYRAPGQPAEPDKGLGLGLSFVAWIVRAHDGTIEVRSESGQGATFLVTVPDMAQKPAPPVAPPQAMRTAN